MKPFFIVLLSCFYVSAALGQQAKPMVPDSTKKFQTVETSCGKCKFGLPGKDCELAVRINGKAYYVDGTDIDSHGDAHGNDGFCNAIRKAEVQGEIVNNRFKLSYFKLKPETSTKTGKAKTKS